MNESKLESTEITSPKIIYRWSHRGDDLGIHLFSDELLEAMIDVAKQNGHTITDDYYTYFDHASWMATDSYGRHLYYLEGKYYVYGDDEDPNVEVRTYYLEMVAIVNPDNTYDPDTFMLELTSGCIRIRKYTGPYPELCSVAWSNLIDVQGYWSDGELSGGPTVEVLETDSYGRVLFSYSEDHVYPGEKALVYLLVMQSKNEAIVSYYPEDCYYSVMAEVVRDKCIFDSEVIEDLKFLNDWEKPMNEEKCNNTEIVTEKPEGNIENGEDDAFLEKIVKDYYVRSGRYIHPKNVSFISNSSFVTKDDYGRELYTVYSRFEEFTDKCETQYLYRFILILMPDGSCDSTTLVLVNDPRNAQEEVKLVKELNNWNKPIE